MQTADDIEVRTCLQFLKLYLNPGKPYYCRFLRIVSGDSEVDESFMPSKYVDVILETGSQSHCFWRGSDVECAPKISKHRKREPPKPKPGDPDQHDRKEVFVRRVVARFFSLWHMPQKS